MTASIVYKAVVSSSSKPDNKYFGIAETTFKGRSRNHAKGFCHKKYVNSTELFKYMRKLKDEKWISKVKRNIMSVVHVLPKVVFVNFI